MVELAADFYTNFPTEKSYELKKIYDQVLMILHRCRYWEEAQNDHYASKMTISERGSLEFDSFQM